MAKPQLENGHTQIANEILEHLMKMHLAPNQWQVLLCVIRKTYGFHKKVDYIANSQIVEATCLCKAVVSRTLRSLSDMGIINRNGKNIGFQKDWEGWQKLAELSTNNSLQNGQPKLAELSTELAELSTKVSSPRVTQKIKDTLTKETIQKKEYGEFNNVRLSDEEYNKIIEKFGEKDALAQIETLSEGIASKGYKYSSHYATILSWHRRDEKGGQGGTHKQVSRQLPNRDKYHER